MTMQHKIGDTFAWGGALSWVDASGTPLDPAGLTGASQLRTHTGALIATLDVTITGGIGETVITVTQRPEDDSNTWPVGYAELDIQLTLPGGAVVSSATVRVSLLRDVTRTE